MTDKKTIIFGLGTGRCGSASLAALLNAQSGTVCFHEMNPACAKWDGSPGFAVTAAREFFAILSGGDRDRLTIDYSSPDRTEPFTRLRALETVHTIGDIAPYYLPYVELLAKEFPNTRFPVLKREKGETVASYVHKMTPPRASRAYRAGLKNHIFRRKTLLRNHWIRHDGSQWRSDVRWDKCYPKFNADTLEDALSQFWDYYYSRAGDLQTKYPDQVRVFNTSDMNNSEGQRHMLEFCGIDPFDFTKFRKNEAAATAR